MEHSESIREQLERLRSSGTPGRLRLQAGIAALVTVGLLSAAAVFQDLALLMIGVLAGLFFLYVRQSSPHIANAIKGLKCGTVHEVEVTLLSSEGIETTSWTCRTEYRGRTWLIPFSPDRWDPRDGTSRAECVGLEGVEWPVLIVTTKGLIVPESRPDIARNP